MEMFRPLRAVLCFYEGLRLVFLIGAFVLLQPAGEVDFPWLALITPGAMFFLMAALHLHGPLYMAGKGLSVITTVFWLFFAKNYIINELFYNAAAIIIAPGIVFFLLLGDMLSVWLVTKITKDSGGG
jgi:hypothetical protein